MSKHAFMTIVVSATLLFVALSTTACSSAMARLYESTSPIHLEKSLTGDQVNVAVLKAMSRKDWTMVEETTGVINAKFVEGDRWAIAAIHYNTLQYSIKHVESCDDLEFNGDNIQARYNDWVRELDQAIGLALIEIAGK